jgi:hypothetical protein
LVPERIDSAGFLDLGAEPMPIPGKNGHAARSLEWCAAGTATHKRVVLFAQRFRTAERTEDALEPVAHGDGLTELGA